MLTIPLIKPYLPDEVKKKVDDVLESGFLTEGQVTREFEESIQEYIGSRHSMAVTSCTTGLELALRALNIGPGDEVIVPDYTYPATADVVSIVGAISVIVDINRATMLIDYDAIEAAITGKTKAVIPVSLFGNPLDYNRLREIKQKHNIWIIEDAACALGAEFKGAKAGKSADISVFSFHPRKLITTGEGGMVVTDRTDWFDWMYAYKHFGLQEDRSRATNSFQSIGTNYKLSNIQAAVGLGQMSKIDEMLERRIELARCYLSNLSGRSNIILPQITPGGRHSYQSFCVSINNRDSVMATLRASGIEVQIGTYSLHQQPAFQPSPACRWSSNFCNSLYAFKHCLSLPLYHEMTMDNLNYVVDSLIKAVNRQA